MADDDNNNVPDAAAKASTKVFMYGSEPNKTLKEVCLAHK